MLATTYLTFITLATYSASAVKSNFGNFRGGYKSLYTPLGTPPCLLWMCRIQQAVQHNKSTTIEQLGLSSGFQHKYDIGNVSPPRKHPRLRTSWQSFAKVQSFTWQFMS